jgi:hypothetical protein
MSLALSPSPATPSPPASVAIAQPAARGGPAARAVEQERTAPARAVSSLALGDPVRVARSGEAGTVLAVQGAVAILRLASGRVIAAFPAEIEAAVPAPEASVRIPRPGVYRLPPEVYHGDPAPEPSLSAGVLTTLLARSPMHARARHPRLAGPLVADQGRCLELGSAAHELFFGLDEHRVEVVEAASWRSKAARALRQEARNRGKAPLLPHELARLLAMVEAAKAQLARSRIPQAFDLAAGEAELSLFWREDVPGGVPERPAARGGGVWLRCRPDWLSHDRRLLLDYKTTARPIPDWSRWTAKELLLDVRAAFYCRVVRRVLGVQPRFAFVVQETVPPFALAVVEVPKPVLEAAERRVEEGIATWARCLARDEWPGYGADAAQPFRPKARGGPRRGRQAR